MAVQIVNEAGWEEVCLLFYRLNDETARQAVEIFEQSQAASSNQAQASTAAHEMLSKIGLSEPSALTPETIKKCVEIKNAARRQVHIEVS
jgi:hypothetical protein